MAQSLTGALRTKATQIAGFTSVIWAVFFWDWFSTSDLSRWGIVPRDFGGLWGILCSPFLHANFAHLLSNTLPLVILLGLVLATQERGWVVVAEVILLGGFLLWLFGRPAFHVGASGLVYGLIAFLLVAGFRQGRLGPALAALVVGFLYGGTLIFGVLPSVGSEVSWDGHLLSAIAGGFLAFISTMRPTPTESSGNNSF
jgi:membrane associated rhomboid family serine protease